MRTTHLPRMRVAAGAQAGAPLFAGAQGIRTIELSEAELLYTGLPDMSNAKHTMLIMYSPTCTYCKGMEAEVKELAKALTGETALQFVALDTSSPAARYFAKNVLGVHALPAFCTFPRQSRTFYKFKGSTRDANSLLKFLNMTCNQREAKLWALPGVAEAAAGEATAKAAPSTAVAAVGKKALSGVTSIDDAAAGTAANPPATPGGPSSIVTGIATCAAVAAALYFAVSRGSASAAERHANSGGVLVSAPASASAESPPSSSAPADSPPKLERLLSDIDTTISRTVSIMVRLVRARIGLVIAPVDDDVPAAASKAAPTGGAPPPPPPLPVTNTGPPAGGLGAPGSGPLGRGAKPTVAAATIYSAAAARMQIEDKGLQAMESALTHELVSVTGLSAEQVMAVMEEEGGNVSRTMDRLLASGSVNVQIKKTKA
ncbi:hypothetical protein FOA52_008990 [Chlamydomonas sp. UWO 241]|nr:hypothetical protein FOA52_008990 [Chlamydomonas sp. UWO 241]